MKQYFNYAALMLIVCIAAIMPGCSSSTRDLNPEEAYHVDASYDFSDKKKIVDYFAGRLYESSLFPPQTKKPIFIVYPVINETSEHISTSGITDDIRMELIRSGRFRFISDSQRDNLVKESSYQKAGYVTPAQRIKQGQQLGADYIMSGTLRSIEKKQPKQWRLKKKEMIFYSLNMDLTDVNSGEMVWADRIEIAREASTPIIGW